jgi:hypothetical protein
VIAQAGFYSMFFFITLYMQNVLHYSPVEAGAAYLPVTVGVGIGLPVPPVVGHHGADEPSDVAEQRFGAWRAWHTPAGYVGWLLPVSARSTSVTGPRAHPEY